MRQKLSILIRNLPKTITQAEVEALFTPYGKVNSCDLVMDDKSGLSKGFGFVEMDTSEGVDKAIPSLNGRIIEGQKIRVKWSNQEKKNQEKNNNPPESYIPANHAPASEEDCKNIWENAKPNPSKSVEDEDQ